MFQLPDFTQIDLSSVPSQLSDKIKHHLTSLDDILENNTVFTWENLLSPMEAMEDELHQFWSPIHHMNSVINSAQLREITNTCLPLLSDYHTAIMQNNQLYEAVLFIQQSDSFASLNEAQQKTIEHMLRDFKLSGVHLPPKHKKTFGKLSKALSQLTHQFEENVLDATMGWKKHITQESELSGIPEHAKQSAKELAQKNNVPGWLFTLEAPSYLAVMMHADNRAFRQSVYEAFVTRASDQGPNAHQWENTELMRKIMHTRFELAKLLGFDNYAELSLATKMVKKTDDVLNFLYALAEKVVPRARAEFDAIAEFAATQLNLKQLQVWDVPYASEKMRQAQFELSQERVRQYFPLHSVIQGIFEVMHKLYGIRVEQLQSVDVWHKDATCYQLIHQEKVIAHMYFDLYARENKRGGAWMDDYRVRYQKPDGTLQTPVTYVTCNFTSPVGGTPALLTHEEVLTLFHECGHALQHMLTQIDVPSMSGINGVPWDAVEIASQFFENWAWEKESLNLFAKHHETHAVLPDDLFARMQNARNFQSAMQMARQLEFALFDFHLHIQYDHEDKDSIQDILNTVRQKVSIVQVPAFNRFQHGFSHIFAGGYAAGYYSYKWAEVMACDAFSLFKEKGIFDRKTAEQFKNTFLAWGGAKEPLELFIEFRGREPSVDALLKQNGIV